MSIIRIPSSKIYDIDGNSSLFKNNKIGEVITSYNKMLRDTGNVLAKRYEFTYWERQGDEEPQYVANDEGVNEVSFFRDGASNGVVDRDWLTLEGGLELLIGKPINIELTQNGFIKGFNISRNQRWLKRIFDQSGKIIEEEETNKTIIDYPEITYDAETSSFNVPYEIEYLPNGSRGTVIYERVIGAVTTTGNDNITYDYLMSETISIEGFYYSPKEILKKYGDISKGDSFSIPQNQLLQERTTINTIEVGLILYTAINLKYKNGKEVHTIRCSVGDYYDTDGNLAISPKNLDLPALLSKFDVVEPYIITSSGEKPLSTKANGSPKQFEIIGIDYTYEGVCWLDLTIQEYSA